MAGAAKSLFDWHERHGFCSACGQKSTPDCGGWKRRCETCSTQHFPRLDPVVIMLAVYEGGDEPVCLLGRQSAWPARRMSALAGFMEPGETIEEACAREVFEEAGLTVTSATYHSSQPWPFPHQLMIGCYGEATNVDITFDTTELEDCRWFTRKEIGAMLSEGSYDGRTLPIQGTIARRLIEDWFEWRH